MRKFFWKTEGFAKNERWTLNVKIHSDIFLLLLLIFYFQETVIFISSAHSSKTHFYFSFYFSLPFSPFPDFSIRKQCSVELHWPWIYFSFFFSFCSFFSNLTRNLFSYIRFYTHYTCRMLLGGKLLWQKQEKDE